ncbi:DNA-binding response OmpR family regulator [Natranaerovirga hydrolytica]|uniref:Stage 0 sporulation protein A homolog n=1 Tax=Natranaerovirga hydrolytica TaxID=680378 RepID=A0A4V6NFA8_9FIRM|nr:response regulator transcription factor [Natranaerovirga hydrolytica]TCK90591.1 DNA-binding response OmpR family regulator [Natranaerovirga hydrolytica]
MRILLVEDEQHLAEAIQQILKKYHYSVDVVSDGESGLECGLSNIYDIIILDIMLPKKDGLSLLKELRLDKITTPVILLTAKSELSDKVIGLDTGADDYLTKPFASEELLARIRALSRRKGELTTDNTLEYGDIVLNTSTLNLYTPHKDVKLTLKESELLEFLMLRKNMVSSKELIIEKIWGYDSEVEHNHVEVYISFLRKKLKYLNASTSIKTVRGIGYILEDR